MIYEYPLFGRILFFALEDDDDDDDIADDSTRTLLSCL
jgi:hypothetical protein